MNDDDFALAPLTDEELATVGDTLTPLAQRLEELARTVLRGEARTGSRREDDSRDSMNLSLPFNQTVVSTANQWAFLAALAGADHVRAFVAAAKSRQGSASSATLTRGGLEALSKAHYLLRSKDIRELIQRVVALAQTELKYTVKHARLSLADGTEVNAEHYLAAFKDLTARAQIVPLKTPSVTELATGLLDLVAGGGHGRAAYSDLSSAAHGEAVTVGAFLRAEPGDLHLPANAGYTYTGVLYGSCAAVGDALIEYGGVEDTERQTWTDIRNDATAAIFSLVERARDAEEFITKPLRRAPEAG